MWVFTKISREKTITFNKWNKNSLNFYPSDTISKTQHLGDNKKTITTTTSTGILKLTNTRTLKANYTPIHTQTLLKFEDSKGYINTTHTYIDIGS